MNRTRPTVIATIENRKTRPKSVTITLWGTTA
jgi:hypothetical protein